MNPADAHRLQLSIIQAIELAPDGQNLNAIHESIRRPRRDLTVLPQVSALVTEGLVEKVAHPADSANGPMRRTIQAQRRPAHSVRFRLTPQGRSALATARDQGEIPPPAPIESARRFVDYDDRVGSPNDD